MLTEAPRAAAPAGRMILHRGSGIVIALERNVCIAMPRGPANADLIAAMRAGLTAVAQRTRNDGFALLLDIGAGSDPPSGATRDAAATVFESFQGPMRAMAVVLEGTGFVVAAKRSVVTFLTRRMVGSTPLRTFAQLADGADWVTARCTALGIPCPSSTALVRTVRDIDAGAKD
jgi:hypothetical protein